MKSEFKDLQELALFFIQRSVAAAERSTRLPLARDRVKAQAEANAWHEAARIVKDTTLTGWRPVGWRMNALLAAAIEALEYFEQREDVLDGDDGQPRANREMQLASALRDAIAEVERRERLTK